MKFTSLLAALLLALAPALLAQEPDTPTPPETPTPDAPEPDQPVGDGESEPKKEVPAPAPAAAPDGTGPVGMRNLDLSPDGTTLTFTLHGDIWTMPAMGGRATRLTLQSADELRPRFSPDGKSIGFTSNRTGSFDVFLMPAEGGEARRVTFDGATDSINSFTADGRNIVFQSSRTGEVRLWQIPVEGGTPTQLVPLSSRGGRFAGDYLYYEDGVSEALRKGYRGTRNDELWRIKLGETPERLTENDQNDREPNPTPDGTTLYFIRETGERGQDYNLFRMNLETKAVEQVTNLDELGLTNLTFNSDFTRVWFVWKYRIWSIDLLSSEKTPEPCTVVIAEDAPTSRKVTRTLTTGAANLDLSADGKTLAFDLGGSIWVVPAQGGEARRITAAGSGDTYPRISPDGRTIAFHSQSRSGNDDIWLIGMDGANLRRLTTNEKGDFFHNWAPCGTYLVFCSDRAGKKDIWRQPIDGSPAVQLTNEAYAEDDPSVSADGRLIAYDAHPSGNADIFVMNADGTGRRRVYGSTAQEESPRFSNDGRFLVFNRTRMGFGATREVVVTDMGGTGEVVIGRGTSGVFSPDGREIYYLSERGEVRAAPAPAALDGGRGVLFLARSEIDEKEQFLGAFDEAWTLVKNNFYDTKYHGLDWDDIKTKYKPIVESARTKMEFHAAVLDMIGELNASHQGIYGPINDIPGYSTGQLGVEDLVVENVSRRRPGMGAPTGGAPGGRGGRRRGPQPANDGEQPAAAPAPAAPAPAANAAARPIRLKVVRPDKGGPLDKAWVRDGDYILGVGNTALTTKTNFYQMLEGKTGQAIQLRVAASDDPEGENARVVEVTPESQQARRARQYRDWVNDNRRKVRDGTRSQVAYIHIPQMNQTALRQFENDVRASQRARAMVLDVRNNGGGNIHQELLDILARRHYANQFNRQGRVTSAPPLYWDRPIVLLINTRSYSDAEVFPHAFKALKLGPIVGEQTPGAVIGTTEATLSDGSGFRVTRGGFRNLDGTNQEGNGCVPDHVVPHTVEDTLKNQDPQLAKAIELAQAAVREAARSGRSAPAARAEGENPPSRQDFEPTDEDEDDANWMETVPEGLLPEQNEHFEVLLQLLR